MSNPLNSTAISGNTKSPFKEAVAAAALPRVWRLRLFAKELVACGFDPEKAGTIGYDAWPIIQKVLLAKGLPEGFTLDRTPVRIRPFEDSVHGPGLELEFE